MNKENKTDPLMKWLTYSLSVLVIFTASCTFTQKIKDGATAYERKQYAVAVEMLAKEFNKSKSRVERGQIAYLLGRSYAAIGENERSIDWFKKSYDNAFGEEAIIAYAFALKKDEQYEEAAKAFKEVGLETGDPITYRKEISACEIAATWKNTPDEQRSYNITSSPVNTSASEYAPTFFNANSLIFTSDRPDAQGEKIYNWTGKDFSDIFIQEANSVSALKGPFNSPHNDGTLSFNADETYAVFTRCFQNQSDDSYCQLMESNLIEGQWTNPQPLPFVEPEINYGQPSVSPGGDVIYFTSNHPDGWGGFDLYRVSKTADEWNEPVILPLRLNTIDNEQFPFIHVDTLYFASDGHGGMGGLDIFRTYIRPNGEWSPVENLKYPINSGGDDFAMIVRSTFDENKPTEGYFTSNRKDGAGADDIYAFSEKIPVIPEPEVVEVDSSLISDPPKKTTSYKIIGYVTGDTYKDLEDPTSKIEGQKTPISNAEIDINIGDQVYAVTSDEKGYFEQVIVEDGSYNFLAAAPEYLNATADLEIVFDQEDKESSEQLFKVEINLERIFRNVEIKLDNIYYDLNKWDIREDAQPTLLELAENLKLNPELIIQLASHTDCRGEDAYNEWLSQKRAESAVNFLIAQGIEAERLNAKGFGESKPSNACVCAQCTSEEHQANRRTTFTILE